MSSMISRPQPSPADLRWYLVRTKPREDRRAVEHLRNQSFDAFAPTCVNLRTGRIALRRILEPLFPGYAFVRLSASHDDWSVLRSTRGVRGLVQFGTHTPAVPDEVVERLRAADGSALEGPWVHLREGDSIRVVAGPLRGLEGVFTERDGEARAFVLLQYMQRQVQVRLPIELLNRAA